ncbi:MAG: hypothetical protein L3J34_04580 [Flavobacteriaceae bacterium]|nr:hypothetical protein [Flavobacteriaceae bacterium]
MKKFLNITFIFFFSFTVAQTCNITLNDILTIDSQESFERVLIENNFERNIEGLNVILKKVLGKEGGNLDNLTEEELDKLMEKMNKDGLGLVKYDFGRLKIKDDYVSEITSAGMFSSDIFFFIFQDNLAEYSDSFYNRIFTEVKGKCTFDEVNQVINGKSAAVYNCPSAKFKGKVGFFLVDGQGMIYYISEGS